MSIYLSSVSFFFYFYIFNFFSSFPIIPRKPIETATIRKSNGDEGEKPLHSPRSQKNAIINHNKSEKLPMHAARTCTKNNKKQETNTHKR